MAHAEFLRPTILEALSQVAIALEGVDEADPEGARPLLEALHEAERALERAKGMVRVQPRPGAVGRRRG